MTQITKEQLQALIKESVDGVLAGVQEQWTTRFADFQKGAALQAPVARTAEEKGLAVGRIVRAIAAGKGDPEKALHFAKRAWGIDANDPVAKALAAGDAVAGGFIVPPAYTAEIVELLGAQTVVRKMRPMIVPMDNGTMSMPKLIGGATATYVGENQNMGVTGQQFGMVRMAAKKLTALVPVSNDLLRFSSPSADTIVRDDMVAAISRREDLAFIRGDGTQDTPRGLRYWVPSANVFAANATINLANVTSDLAHAILLLEQGNVRMLRPGWMFAPRTKQYLMSLRDTNGNFAFRDEMLKGQLWQLPYATTTQIPVNLGGGTDESEIYLADFADVMIGEASQLILDASTEAAYYDGSNVQASFSLDQTVIRAIVQHDLGVRHAESLVVISTVKWTP